MNIQINPPLCPICSARLTTYELIQAGYSHPSNRHCPSAATGVPELNRGANMSNDGMLPPGSKFMGLGEALSQMDDETARELGR